MSTDVNRWRKGLLTFCAVCLGAFGNALLASGDLNCQQADTTVAMTQCLQQQRSETEAVMAQYLDNSLQQYQQSDDIISRMKTAQASWLTYREDHCRSVYAVWQGGSIRNISYLSCVIQQTEARAMSLWQAFLENTEVAKPDFSAIQQKYR